MDWEPTLDDYKNIPSEFGLKMFTPSSTLSTDFQGRYDAIYDTKPEDPGPAPTFKGQRPQSFQIRADILGQDPSSPFYRPGVKQYVLGEGMVEFKTIQPGPAQYEAYNKSVQEYNESLSAWQKENADYFAWVEKNEAEILKLDEEVKEYNQTVESDKDRFEEWKQSFPIEVQKVFRQATPPSLKEAFEKQDFKLLVMQEEQSYWDYTSVPINYRIGEDDSGSPINTMLFNGIVNLQDLNLDLEIGEIDAMLDDLTRADEALAIESINTLIQNLEVEVKELQEEIDEKKDNTYIYQSEKDALQAKKDQLVAARGYLSAN